MAIKNTSSHATEQMVIDTGYQQLSSKELKQRICGKTILGDYLQGRTYISYVDQNGDTEGNNDLGTHLLGIWSINDEDNTFSVEWDGY